MIDLLTHNVTLREWTFQDILPQGGGPYPRETLGYMPKAPVSGFFLSQVHYVAFPAIRPPPLELPAPQAVRGTSRRAKASIIFRVIRRMGLREIKEMAKSLWGTLN